MSAADLYGFGSDPLSNPFYPQRTTDWGHSGIDPSAIQMPSSPWVEARQSPHFPIPSQTHSSSQSDSDRLSPCSAATSLSPPHATTPQPPLEEKRRKIMTECAPAPPVVRNAVSSVVNSLEWQSQGDIHSDLLMPIVEPIHFANGGRSGSRGGIDCYRCRFGLCTKVIKRRDHMLNHVRCHLGLKPWVCAFISVDAHKQWSDDFTTFPTLSPLIQPLLSETRFLRIDDLKRHLRHLHKHDMDENGYASFLSLSFCFY